MRFLDSLLGRTRPAPSREDRIFAMTTAAIGLQAAGLEPAGRVGVLFKRLPPGRFDQLEREVTELLRLQGAEDRMTAERRSDELGYDWLVLSGSGLEEAVAAQHTIVVRFTEEGLGDLLLACLFRFRREERAVFWVYSYKRSSFYPFVPLDGRRRDTEEELRLAALARHELPEEQDQSTWFPIWDAPV